MVCRSRFEDKWGRSFASRKCFGCKVLALYAADGDSASIVEVYCFPNPKVTWIQDLFDNQVGAS